MMAPTTEQFVDTVFGPKGRRTGDVWICHFPGWSKHWGGGPYPAKQPRRDQNNFFAISTYKADRDGDVKRDGDNFVAMHVLVADDVGTKVPTPPIEPTYKIETSPGNFQYAYVLAEPIRDKDEAGALVDALIAAGYCDPGNDGPQTRYVRLPGINGKPEHLRDGKSPAVAFREWHPDRKFTVAELVVGLGLKLEKAPPPPNTETTPKGNRAEWIRQIIAGEDLHGSTLSLANSLISRGTPAKVALDTIQHLMDASSAPMDDRFAERYNDVPRLVADAFKKYGPKPVGPLAVISASEFARRPRPEWIIKSLLPRAEFGVAYGESGAGKSFAVLDLVWHVAKGIQWHGKRVKPCRVVYVAAEGAGGFQTRLEALAKHRDETLDGVPIGIMAGAPNLLEGGELALIEAIKASGGAGLVVIDTLAQTTPGANENTSEDMGKAIAAVKHISAALDAMVLIVHHAGKDLSRGARGWSGMKGAADVQFEIGRNGDDRYFEIEKSKDGADGMRYHFRLESVPLGDDGDGDPVSSCVVEWIKGKPKVWEPKGEWQKRIVAAVGGILDDLAFDGNLPAEVSMPVEKVIEKAISTVPKPPNDRRREMARKAIRLIVEAFVYSLSDDGTTLKVPNATSPT